MNELYEVYKISGNEDNDELVKSNLTLEQAKELKGDRKDYVILPQYINGA